MLALSSDTISVAFLRQQPCRCTGPYTAATVAGVGAYPSGLGELARSYGVDVSGGLTVDSAHRMATRKIAGYTMCNVDFCDSAIAAITEWPSIGLFDGLLLMFVGQ